MAVGPGGAGTARAVRTFVPVEALEPAQPLPYAAPGPTGQEPSGQASLMSRGPAGGRRIPGTWWLWGDPDPWPEP